MAPVTAVIALLFVLALGLVATFFNLCSSCCSGVNVKCIGLLFVFLFKGAVGIERNGIEG